MEQVIISDKNNENEKFFYTVTMRGLVAFPKMVMHFDVARKKSVKAIESAIKGNGKIFLVAQKEAYTENPKLSDVYKTGVVAEIKQILRLPDNVMKILVQGVYKAKIVNYVDDGEKIMAEVKRMPSYSKAKYDEAEAEALMRSIKNAFEHYASFFPKMPNDLMISVMTQSSPIKLFESIVFSCNLDYKDKQVLLEETNIISKLTSLLSFLISETEILEIEHDINEQTRNNIEKTQREYYLREQLKIIQEQLGEEDGDENFRYMTKVMTLECDEKSRD